MVKNQEVNLDLMNVSDFEEDDGPEQGLQVNVVDSSVDSSRNRKRKIVVESARNLLK